LFGHIFLFNRNRKLRVNDPAPNSMKSDGKLTKKERAKLTKEQNKAGKKIHKKKHNEKKVDVGESK